MAKSKRYKGVINAYLSLVDIALDFYQLKSMNTPSLNNSFLHSSLGMRGLSVNIAVSMVTASFIWSHPFCAGTI